MSSGPSLASILQPSATFQRSSVLTTASFANNRSTSISSSNIQTQSIAEIEELESEIDDGSVDLPSDFPLAKPSVKQVESTTAIVPFYRHPRLLAILKIFAFNLFLPFLSGVFMGFGEICANEVTFKWGWVGARTFSTGLYSQPKDK
ncbi:hypothetical protein K493DRAFT_284699 [Basidiobolus meristosporus CBS 931.73]|uniref:TOM13-domain-containing protein n=1 Tax=Basidiobolus meristosporus CBS 931.73 TaxID=1314790 RepID=A0A1Y1Y612_9FUNG|nr:hypothetical protein K493DRAFT_284699 [Basidiobolus meristosporus CBS 931.73]|eukprot:ORX93433.1 hypothetical protein K493DRAFT_284699 [Basidiobolus meristosporus CBS 931.73]